MSNTAPLEPQIEQQKRTTNTAGLLMLLIFFAPVVLAYGLLKTGVYQDFGTSNNGQLLETPTEVFSTIKDWPTVQGDPVNEELLSNYWWIAYALPEQCDNTCEQRLLQIRQSVQTLGPELQRVRPLILVEPDRDISKLLLILEQLAQKNIQALVVQSPAQEHLEHVLNGEADLEPGGLYIVDPLGFSVLYYEPVSLSEAAISQAKLIIKDLKYLLKVSRIG